MVKNAEQVDIAPEVSEEPAVDEPIKVTVDHQQVTEQVAGKLALQVAALEVQLAYKNQIIDALERRINES